MIIQTIEHRLTNITCTIFIFGTVIMYKIIFHFTRFVSHRSRSKVMTQGQRSKFWTCVPICKLFGWRVKECITYQVIYYFWCREWPLTLSRDLWPWPMTLEACKMKDNFMHYQCAKCEYSRNFISESMFNCLKYHAYYRYPRYMAPLNGREQHNL